eukprot:1785171-Alexandrium_andersonii.AAC.1
MLDAAIVQWPFFQARGAFARGAFQPSMPATLEHRLINMEGNMECAVGANMDLHHTRTFEVLHVFV